MYEIPIRALAIVPVIPAKNTRMLKPSAKLSPRTNISIPIIIKRILNQR